MYTYALLNVIFVGGVLLLDLYVLRTKVILKRRTWLVIAILFALTAVFDQLLVTYIVGYNDAQISGLKLGVAPIEDFAYSFAAVIGIGSVLEYERRKHTH